MSKITDHESREAIARGETLGRLVGELARRGHDAGDLVGFMSPVAELDQRELRDALGFEHVGGWIVYVHTRARAVEVLRAARRLDLSSRIRRGAGRHLFVMQYGGERGVLEANRG